MRPVKLRNTEMENMENIVIVKNIKLRTVHRGYGDVLREGVNIRKWPRNAWTHTPAQPWEKTVRKRRHEIFLRGIFPNLRKKAQKRKTARWANYRKTTRYHRYTHPGWRRSSTVEGFSRPISRDLSQDHQERSWGPPTRTPPPASQAPSPTRFGTRGLRSGVPGQSG